MLIAHNKSFDYWLATDLLYSIKISESKQSKILQDNAVFKPYGIYTVSTNGKTHIVAKQKNAEELEYGLKASSHLFDEIGVRKTAYKTSASRLLARLNGIHQNLGELKGKEPVKIYKKKSNKKANSKD